MVILNTDHPDMPQGLGGHPSLTGVNVGLPAYDSGFFQNANQSVGVFHPADWKCQSTVWQCDSTVNDWHICPNMYPTEYMFLDGPACNLASLNLLKFVGMAGEFH